MRIRTYFNLLLLPVLTAVVAVAACCSTGANGGKPAAVTAVAEQSGSSNQNPSEDPASAIERYAKTLEKNPADANARETLKRLIDSPNPVSTEQSQRIREILRQYARAEKVNVANKDEPGERLTVSGTVRNTAGQRVAGALIYVFQTDTNGHYTRTRVMNEPNARLFGFVKTDNAGHYEFNTIRPGGYPGAPGREGERWRIPQHIHFQVAASGYQFRNFQMVFADDPRMTPYWHDWARKGNNTVVAVNRDSDGGQHVVCDISLQ
jgi:protocatechuate 3,4-dioxygenase beta subunit